LGALSNDALDDLPRRYPRVGAGSCDREPSIDRSAKGGFGGVGGEK
jgi:hypothetical protein